MRRCLFGGTFDPPHVGHLMMAEVARESLALDVVEFIPTGLPPHKIATDVTPAHQRVLLVERALETFPSFRVSRVEVDRSGPSYTVDTVRYFRHLYADDDLFFLLGADMLLDFPNWHHSDEIARQVCLVVAPRPRIDLPAAIRTVRQRVPGATCIPLDMPELDVSSSWVRGRVGNGLRVDPLLPPGVVDVIGQKGMYSGEKSRR